MTTPDYHVPAEVVTKNNDAHLIMCVYQELLGPVDVSIPCTSAQKHHSYMTMMAGDSTVQ